MQSADARQKQAVRAGCPSVLLVFVMTLGGYHSPGLGQGQCTQACTVSLGDSDPTHQDLQCTFLSKSLQLRVQLHTQNETA